MIMTNVIEFIDGLADGGAETIVKDYALLLDPGKFQVTVLTLFPPADTANRRHLAQAGVKVRSIYPKTNLFYRAIHKAAGKRLVAARLRAVMKEQKTDVLHVHMALLHFLPPILDALKDKKVFYTCHSFPEDYFGRERHRGEAAAAELLFRECDFRMIAIAEGFVAELNRMFDTDNTVYLHNGINAARFHSREYDRSAIRRELGIAGDAFVVGNIGRFVAYKNKEFVLEIFAELKKTQKNAFLLLVGDGPLELGIREKIREMGLEDSTLMVSHRTDIPELLTAMDVFLYPARREGLGIVMIEAQAAGLRCVVSDTMQPDVFVTDHIFPVSLNAPLLEWCGVMLHGGESHQGSYSLSDYDMRTVVRQLEKLYLGE